MPDAKVVKTYVRPDNKAVIICPHCQQQKIILADSFRGPNYKFKAKCNCQKTFMVHLEFRKHIRKKTKLAGTDINHSPAERSGPLIIQNISMTGLSFAYFDVKGFKVGDKLNITFNLDDHRQAEISKEVIVIDVNQSLVGCKFEAAEKDFSPPGYYINATN